MFRWFRTKLALDRQLREMSHQLEMEQLKVDAQDEIISMQREAMESVTACYRAMWAQNSIVANELTRKIES